MSHPLTRQFARIAVIAALPFAFAACNKASDTPKADSVPAVAPPPAPAANPDQAPDSFRVAFETDKGVFVIEAKRAYSPLGVDRFYALVKSGYFTDVRFYRVVKGFMAQFGFAADPAVTAQWRDKPIRDEPVVLGNKRGTISYAKPGAPDARSDQFFINYGDNSAGLDAQGFSAFGTVVEGMDIVDKINDQYGEAPDQGMIAQQGAAYLKKSFPKLTYIKSATILGGAPVAGH